MNASGDDHVSFTAMGLSSSANGKFLLVATDRNQIILYRTKTAKHVRNFHGADNDSYSHPVCCWSVDENYVYGTSQTRNVSDWLFVCASVRVSRALSLQSIMTWHVGSQKLVHQVSAHDKILVSGRLSSM